MIVNKINYFNKNYLKFIFVNVDSLIQSFTIHLLFSITQYFTFHNLISTNSFIQSNSLFFIKHDYYYFNLFLKIYVFLVF